MKIYLILINFFIFTQTFGQTANSFTSINGLPSNHVYGIEQDSEGFLWFSTNSGLCKYDGKNIKLFTSNNGLPKTDTWYIEADDKGRIWCISKGKYQGYIKKDSIYKFSLKENSIISPGLYCYSENKFLIKDVDNWNTSKNIKRFISILEDKIIVEKKIIFDSSDIFSRIRNLKRNGNYPTFYNYTKDNNICYLDKKIYITDNEYNFIDSFPIPFKSKKKAPLTQIQNNYDFRKIYDNEYQLYVNEGICFFNPKLKKVRFYSYQELVGKESFSYCRTFVKEDFIQVIVPNYLFLFDKKYNFIKSYHFPGENDENRPFLDKDGNVWLANFSNGVHFIPKHQLNNSIFFKNKKIDKISNIDNQLYVGVQGDGFYNKTKSIFNKIADSKGLIYQIKKNDDLIYLVSARNSHIINTDINYLNSIFNILKSINQDSYKDIVVSNNDLHIIGASNYFKFNNKTGKFQSKFRILGAKYLINFKDKLFIGGSNGLQYIKENQIYNVELKNKLLSIPINFMKVINNMMFVGTDGAGVYIYDNQNIIPINSSKNLSVQKIIVENDFLWLATQHGIKKIKLNYQDLKSSEIVDEFYKEDGLLLNNINDIALLNDTLYAGTDIGLCYVALKSDYLKSKPNIYFKNNIDHIQLKNKKDNQLNIDFGVIDFIKQDRITYTYRLLPHNKQWIPTKTTSINYSNLSIGKYSLEVKATDHHGNQNIKQLPIHITPLFYQTLTARIFIGLLSLLLLLFIFRIINNWIQNKKLIKAEYNREMVHLELDALRSQMNPHFIHNLLNGILYYIQRNESTMSKTYLKKFSSLVNYFFEYGKNENISLNKEINFLRTYLELEQLRFENKLNYEISIDSEFDIDHIMIPTMLLQPLIENAVNHGIFHKRSPGLVTLRIIGTSSKSFEIEIEDDGIGFIKAQKLYNRKSKNYKSKSSDILKKRLSLLQKNKDWKINYDITDLSTKGNQTGTFIRLSFTRQ